MMPNKPIWSWVLTGVHKGKEHLHVTPAVVLQHILVPQMSHTMAIDGNQVLTTHKCAVYLPGL